MRKRNELSQLGWEKLYWWDSAVFGVAELRDEQISGSQASYSSLKILHPVNQQRRAVFDYMAAYASHAALEHSSNGSFTGCIFHHAASEFRPLSHPIHQAVIEHKQQLLDIFEEEAEALGHPTPKALAQTLLVLIDGAFSSAQIMGDMSMFDQACDAAEILITV